MYVTHIHAVWSYNKQRRQGNLDLVTLWVSTKNVMKLQNVTKYVDFFSKL